MVSTNAKCISLRTGSGTSSRSVALRFGRMTVVMPADGPEHLLLDAADGEHLAAQRDLAGHGHVVTHQAAGKQRGQRGGDGDARRRPVFGTAPAGTWMCRSTVSKKSGAIPSRSARARTKLSAACADSFITSPGAR